MKRKIEYGLLLIVLCGVYIWTNQKMTLGVCSFFAILLVICIVQNKIGARKVDIAYDVLRVSEKDVAKLNIEINNAGLFPTSRVEMQVVFENVVFGAGIKRNIAVSCGGKTKESYLIPIESSLCGRIDISVPKISVYDWLGCSKVKKRPQNRCCYYEYPPYQYKELYDAEGLASEGEETTYKHVRGNDVSEILQVKEYTRGDSIKNIHWKISAKMGKTMVKELDCPNDNSVMLLFDYAEAELKEENNRIIQAVSSISQDMVNNLVGHTVFRMNTSDETVVYREVSAPEEFDCLEQEILETEAKPMRTSVGDYVVDQGFTQRFSKIIYVISKEQRLTGVADLEQCILIYA